MTDVRIVVVDDHQVVRDGLVVLLESVPDFTVVAEAASGEEAVEVVSAAAPDVVLMDVEMPGIGGIEATRRIVAANPATKILVLTMYAEEITVLSAVRAGARGYILKGAQQHDVQRTIRAVARGDAVFGNDVAGSLLHALTSDSSPRPFPALTSREHDVLALLAEGLSNGVIARRLGLSPRTVANHVSNVLTKLPAADRTDAGQQARSAGLHFKA